jgi:hypothetical protein
MSTVYVDAMSDLAFNSSVQPSLAKLVSDIKDRASSVSSRIDVDLMKADDQPASYQMKVNGKDTTVKAITAKNWYGQITVLDDPQNPLVLAFDFNPPMDGITATPEDVSLLKQLLSYKIVEMNP